MNNRIWSFGQASRQSTDMNRVRYMDSLIFNVHENNTFVGDACDVKEKYPILGLNYCSSFSKFIWVLLVVVMSVHGLVIA